MAQPTWQNRIVGYEDVNPASLTANPANFRTHPKHQADALAGILSEVGVVQNVIVNKRTGFVVDGHLRIALAMRDNQPTVPVTYVDLEPHEEALILATLDPISALATADADKLRDLLDTVSTSDAAVMQMLADLAEGNGIIPEDSDCIGAGSGAADGLLLKFGDNAIPLTADELEGLTTALSRHANERGTMFGFARALLEAYGVL